jgi:hypothetical protein
MHDAFCDFSVCARAAHYRFGVGGGDARARYQGRRQQDLSQELVSHFHVLH